MRPTARTSALVALGLLVAGTVAVRWIGGVLAGSAGVLAVAVGLVVFCRAAFHLAEGPARSALRETGDRRMR